MTILKRHSQKLHRDIYTYMRILDSFEISELDTVHLRNFIYTSKDTMTAMGLDVYKRLKLHMEYCGNLTTPFYN